jgi:hypothetical protein
MFAQMDSSPFDALPDEVLAHILNKVDDENVKELLNAQQVCHRWHSASFSVADIDWPLSSTASGAALV